MVEINAPEPKTLFQLRFYSFHNYLFAVVFFKINTFV